MKDMLHATGHGSLALCRAQNAPSGCGPAPCHTLPWQLPARLPAQPRLPADCAPAWSCPCHRQTPAPHAFRKVPRNVSLDARSFRSHSHDDPGWPDQPHLAFRLYATSLPSLLQSSVLHMVDGCVRGCCKATSRWEVCVCVMYSKPRGCDLLARLFQGADAAAFLAELILQRVHSQQRLLPLPQGLCHCLHRCRTS